MAPSSIPSRPMIEVGSPRVIASSRYVADRTYRPEVTRFAASKSAHFSAMAQRDVDVLGEHRLW